MKNINNVTAYDTDEHTLVCLSPSPYNANIIRTAAKMATAFKGSLTALYVQMPDDDKISESDKKRLQDNIELAKSLGADIATVYGDDVSYQIAEFSRLSGVTKIVIGSSNATRRHFWSKPTLTEKLTKIAPNVEIHIIKDSSASPNYSSRTHSFFRNFIPYPKDLIITIFILTAATLSGLMFSSFGFTDANIITVYILGVLLTSLFTRGYTCSILASLFSVSAVNFLFTEPRFTFHAYDPSYPVTFAIMLTSSIITGTLAAKLKSSARLSAQAAFRTKLLLDTNQLLQKVHDDDDIINITASQITKLLNRTVVIYTIRNGVLSKGSLFPSPNTAADTEPFLYDEYKEAKRFYKAAADGGSVNEIYSSKHFMYLMIHTNSRTYGIVGIQTDNVPIESFETSILLSILGECALALDNIRNIREKELAAVLAKNEQLRADLLRAISHDLRTPLTSISGNAATLLSNYDRLDEQTRIQIFTDIYDDSQWLISIVENLLSVTRIEEGRMNFNMSVYLIDEVIEEALKHINRKSSEHQISAVYEEELLLAKIDAKLIIQVIVNLIDNAIKYTPAGSVITITAKRLDGFISVSVADSGNGIPDEKKEKVFEMFYTGDNKIADSCRSLGLGLPVCKAIISAHGGTITLKDNTPKGSVFTFTIPSGEVVLND